jgi:hypothetical protein
MQGKRGSRGEREMPPVKGGNAYQHHPYAFFQYLIFSLPKLNFMLKPNKMLEQSFG